MAFKRKEFLNARLVPRTGEYPVPDMAEWFDSPEEAVFKVRGLTGYELATAQNSPDRNKQIMAIIEGLSTRFSADTTEAVKEYLGLNTTTPADVVVRLEMIQLGSVDPVVDADLAIRMCTTFPIEFNKITDLINQLTGKGHEPGKPASSGGTQECGEPSPSAT